MGLLNVRCTNAACDRIDEIVRMVRDYGTPYPPCVHCGSAVELIHLPPQTTWRADPVVVYQAPDGTYRYPGSTESQSTAHYDRLGYTRVELRNAAEVRRFEKDVNRREQTNNQQRTEAQHRQREARESTNRSDLFHRMKTFSTAGRDIARAAMARGNARPQERTAEAGFRVEVYSENRSSRDAARGNDGRRRRD